MGRGRPRTKRVGGGLHLSAASYSAGEEEAEEEEQQWGSSTIMNQQQQQQQSSNKRWIRSPNFTLEDKLLLTDLVIKYRTVVENKRTDAASSRDKDAAWEAIALQFNRAATTKRDAVGLRNAFSNMKQSARKSASGSSSSSSGASSSCGSSNNKDPAAVEARPGQPCTACPAAAAESLTAKILGIIVGQGGGDSLGGLDSDSDAGNQHWEPGLIRNTGGLPEGQVEAEKPWQENEEEVIEVSPDDIRPGGCAPADGDYEEENPEDVETREGDPAEGSSVSTEFMEFSRQGVPEGPVAAAQERIIAGAHFMGARKRLSQRRRPAMTWSQNPWTDAARSMTSMAARKKNYFEEKKKREEELHLELIALIRRKARVQEEKARAHQEKAKVQQEKAKAQIEKAKAQAAKAAYYLSKIKS